MSFTDNPPGLTKSMYVIGEIDEPSLSRSSRSKWYYLLPTILGVGIFSFGVVVYLFSASIMVIRGLRSEFWNWGFVSLGLSLLLFYISGIMRNKYGYAIFRNSYNSYAIHSVLGTTTRIVKSEIYAISVIEKPSNYNRLPKRYYAVVSTYNRTIRIPLHRYNNQDQLREYFSEMSHLLQDEYFSVFQKSDVTYPSLITRIWSQTGGKIGLGLTFIYLIIGLWGAFSMLLYPSNTLNARSFFLRNPEISNSFLPGYDSQSIIYVPPNDQFLLGTDWIGRDVFARLVYGTVHALGVSLLASSIFIILAILLGFSTAIYEGWWDELISRVADTLLTFPPVILILIIATFASGLEVSFLEQYYYIVFSVLALLTWPQGMKILRTETKQIMKEEYVSASRVLGASNWHLVAKHVLPKTGPSLIYLFIYTVTEVIIAMTMIGIIGFGLGSNLTWGSDLERAITFTSSTDVPIDDRWWTVIYPSLWVALFIIGLTLVSDSIRDQLHSNPNQIDFSGVDES